MPSFAQEKCQVRDYIVKLGLCDGIDQLIITFPKINTEHLLDILEDLEKDGIIKVG